MTRIKMLGKKLNSFGAVSLHFGPHGLFQDDAPRRVFTLVEQYQDSFGA